MMIIRTWSTDLRREKHLKRQYWLEIGPRDNFVPVSSMVKSPTLAQLLLADTVPTSLILKVSKKNVASGVGWEVIQIAASTGPTMKRDKLS